MRSYGCDACGATTDLDKSPERWANVRLVRRGHKPTTYLLCPGCTGEIEHFLTASRRGQTRLHVQGPERSP